MDQETPAAVEVPRSELRCEHGRFASPGHAGTAPCGVDATREGSKAAALLFKEAWSTPPMCSMWTVGFTGRGAAHIGHITGNAISAPEGTCAQRRNRFICCPLNCRAVLAEHGSLSAQG